MHDKKFLQSKCRNMLKEYADVLELVQKEIMDDLEKDRVIGNSAFEYAKKTIRKEGMREGITNLIAKINKYASE
jgi:urease gamma subunit